MEVLYVNNIYFASNIYLFRIIANISNYNQYYN